MHLSPGVGAGSGGSLGSVQIENASGTIIDPATEETLQSVAGFNIPAYDYVGITYPNDTTEVYTFKTGGSGGVTVGVITLVYTDDTKENLSSATKS